jgi:hypothetical protein
MRSRIEKLRTVPLVLEGREMPGWLAGDDNRLLLPREHPLPGTKGAHRVAKGTSARGRHSRISLPCEPCKWAARARMFRTDEPYHRPPRAVAMPRAFRASAISSRVLAPAR